MFYSLYQSECFATHCLWLSVGDEMVHKSYKLCESLTFELMHISNIAWGNVGKPQIIYFVYRGMVVIKWRSSWMISWNWKKLVCQILSSHSSIIEDADWVVTLCHWVFSSTLKTLHFLQNTGKHLPCNTVSHPSSESSRRRQDCTGFLILNLINTLKRW